LITLRDSDIFFGFVLAGVLLLGLMFFDAAVSRRIDQPRIEERRQLVGALALTDLCLFTEARYTRHPGLADLHSPFQDHPMALEHFPSGSLLPVPPFLSPRNGSDR
jgi:hypothetical protein